MDKVIHKTLQLPCSQQIAFDLFTDSKKVVRWLAAQADIQPIVGGSYQLFWEPETPEDNSTIGCRITALQAPEFCAFEWKSPKQFKQFANVADPLTHVTVFFLPTRKGTTVHLVHSGWRHTEEWEEARRWQEKAWAMGFMALNQYVTETMP